MAQSLSFWLGLVYILMAPAVTHSQTTAGWSTTPSISHDLSGHMISRTSRGVITLKGSSSHPDIDAITTCLRMFTDPADYDTPIFTLKIGYYSISLMKPLGTKHKLTVMGGSIYLYPMTEAPSFGKVFPWTSLCVTWDSDTGMAQLWKDGMMSNRKGIARKWKFSGNPVMTISQFEGQLTDIHVWDKVLPLSSLRAYMRGRDYPSGNLLSWRNMTYSSEGYVVLEDSYQTQDKSTENRRSGNQQQQRRRHGRRGDGKCSHGRGRHHKRQRAVEAL